MAYDTDTRNQLFNKLMVLLIEQDKKARQDKTAITGTIESENFKMLSVLMFNILQKQESVKKDKSYALIMMLFNKRLTLDQLAIVIKSSNFTLNYTIAVKFKINELIASWYEFHNLGR